MPAFQEAVIPSDLWYHELGVDEGLEEGVAESGPWARKPYLVNWADRTRFVNALFSTGNPFSGPGTPWIRPLRFRYPDATFSNNIFAKGVSIKGTGDYDDIGDTGLAPIKYKNAIVTVEFGFLDWMGGDANNSLTPNEEENQALQYATQELDFTAEYVNVPMAVVSFTDGKKYDTPMSRRIGVIKETLTWHRLPYLPVSELQTYTDCVNADVFLGNSRGTCFFEGAKTTREMDDRGEIVQKVTMSFKWRIIDWNKFMRPDTGAWDTIIYNGDPTKTTFEYKDFTPLFW